MVHMNILAEVQRPTYDAEWHGGDRHLPPSPKVTIQSLTVMMKHGHIGKTKIVGDQQADSA